MRGGVFDPRPRTHDRGRGAQNGHVACLERIAARCCGDGSLRDIGRRKGVARGSYETLERRSRRYAPGPRIPPRTQDSPNERITFDPIFRFRSG